MSLDALRAERQTLSREVEQLKAERDVLEQTIYALRPESQDTEFIEEIARQRLYMMYPGEILVVFENNSEPPYTE